MRIVIDLQSVQGFSAMRGIGRYSLALTRGIVRNKGAHDIHIALSDLLPENVERLRGAFFDSLPPENIHVWTAQPDVASNNPSNAARRQNAEAQREAFLGSLCPDMVIVTSLFEGLGEDVVTSINIYTALPTAVVLYDLIPFIYRDRFLSNQVHAEWYYEKLVQLKRADLFLAISESSRLEGIDLLGIDPDRIIDISAGTDPSFQPRHISTVQRDHLRERYGLLRDFVMYTGNIEWHKNIEGLVRAYAGLPLSLRRNHQLAIVWGAQPAELVRLEHYAKDNGLEPDEVVVTGFVPDNDLLTLYNACMFFVFPSFHEGFGLPALEAMQCGKAVIASNTSSLPEVVGRRDALFDPYDETAITAMLQRVMEDDTFRADLERHGPVQAAKFSWDTSAQRAIAAIQRVAENRRPTSATLRLTDRKRLAYVSPLPPEQSGISDYSAELVRALSRYYEIDVIVDQPQVSDDWIVVNCRQRNTLWFRSGFREYDRILYHFGNSPFHEHMFELLETAPGSVVLHDFFLSSLQKYRGSEIFLRSLRESHGYKAVFECLSGPSAQEVIYRYPANLTILQNSIGVIVHAENSRHLANDWYGVEASNDWAVVPQLRAPSRVNSEQREAARKFLRIPPATLLICNFGLIGPPKLNDRLIQAFIDSKFAKNPDVHLVFVGECDGGQYGEELRKMIAASGIAQRIRITGWADRETFTAYLFAADMAVQLRALSRGESSRSVLDCMSHGLATVVNANGAMAELDRDCVWMLNDQFEDRELTSALEGLGQDPTLRSRIGNRAQETVRNLHSPERCAALYFESIEGFYARDANEVGGLVRRLSARRTSEAEARELVCTLSRNFPPRPRLRQLLVDVSAIVREDLKSGIQRVVREILHRWLLDPPAGWSVEPIYADRDSIGYQYARRFTCALLGVDDSWAQDEPVDAWSVDKFVGLDWLGQDTAIQQAVLERWYRNGVDICFVVHDLLPVLRPDFFPDGSESGHQRYLKCITSFSSAICVSQAVAHDLRDWWDKHATNRSIPLDINWFHLGADIKASSPSIGLPLDAKRLLGRLREVPSFLMVGTLEPRKGHRQALAAFDILWRNGIDANLIIVGQQGWMVEDFMAYVSRHSRLGTRLFRPENVSDEYLVQIYSACACLLVASEGEGFGLPLVEAAQHGLPIIARDLPVFREVAGDHAFYFDGLKAEDLASALTDWLKLWERNAHTHSAEIKWLTWAQSAEMLLARLGIGQNPASSSQSLTQKPTFLRGA